MMAQTVSSGCVTRRAVLGADSSKVKGGIGDVMVRGECGVDDVCAGGRRRR